jgi:CHAD domain-containing protein
MEVLYVSIGFVLVVFVIFLFKKLDSKRIESNKKKTEILRKESLKSKIESLKSKIESLKSKGLEENSIKELEVLKEQLLKFLKELHPSSMIEFDSEYRDLERRFEKSSKQLIYSFDIRRVEELKMEIQTRKENNLDFIEFQEDLDWKKSKIKEEYFQISKLDKGSSEWLFKESIITEEEYNLSIKLYNERVISIITSQVELIIGEFEKLG